MKNWICKNSGADEQSSEADDGGIVISYPQCILNQNSSLSQDMCMNDEMTFTY